MHTGKVKWFNNAKGFGFIVSPDFEEDLFAHYSVIQSEGYKSLRAGQSVQFETAPGPKGTHAINIRLLALSETEEID
ncbi:cold shock domain-containing protein [Amphritea atlantica]|jgi:CspA family cold shock protein|uniref:cold shock domain-containing protein n=1 Tax=Amphritea atlantica TaxID=355243 RepID=UPI000A3E8AF8|nr:cold shock domain-containing protein [Amphritea atlantica]